MSINKLNPNQAALLNLRGDKDAIHTIEVAAVFVLGLSLLGALNAQNGTIGFSFAGVGGLALVLSEYQRRKTNTQMQKLINIMRGNS